MSGDVEEDLIHAAGGLLWRSVANGYEIAIIHRARYDDWTLPKGKLNEAESWVEAAIREVEEETGYLAVPNGFAGVVSYQTDSGPKVVRYWHMSHVDESRSPIDPEVSEVYWLPIGEARKRVQYPGEQALLEAWESPGRQALPEAEGRAGAARASYIEDSLSWYHRNLASPSLPRLSYSLPVVQAELEALISARQAEEDYNFKGQWDQLAIRLLKESARALQRRNADLGWRCLKAADRYMLYGLDDSSLRNRARIVLTEAIDEEKGVTKWRQRSIETLLEDIDAESDEGKVAPIMVEDVFEAKRLLDEHQDNVYARLSILKTRLLALTVGGAVMLLSWLLITPPVPEETMVQSHSLMEVIETPIQFWLVVILAGVLGALISAFTSAMGADPKRSRIPSELTTSVLMAARIMLGALSALAVTLFLLAGFLSFTELSYQLIVAAAIVSGITDRLLLLAIERSTN